jgi:hypothetical protein
MGTTDLAASLFEADQFLVSVPTIRIANGHCLEWKAVNSLAMKHHDLHHGDGVEH